MSTEPRKYWLDDRANVNKVVYALYILCAVLVALDFLGYKHTHFGFENWFGFYAFYGFVGYVGLVLTAKVLRTIVMRDEDYYD